MGDDLTIPSFFAWDTWSPIGAIHHLTWSLNFILRLSTLIVLLVSLSIAMRRVRVTIQAYSSQRYHQTVIRHQWWVFYLIFHAKSQTRFLETRSILFSVMRTSTDRWIFTLTMRPWQRRKMSIISCGRRPKTRRWNFELHRKSFERRPNLAPVARWAQLARHEV